MTKKRQNKLRGKLDFAVFIDVIRTENMVDFTKTKIIVDYKWKYTIYAVLCWCLMLFGFFKLFHGNTSWQFWLAGLIFCGFASILTFMLLSGKFLFVGKKGPLFNEFLHHKYGELMSRNGRFKFYELTVEFDSDHGPLYINWKDINKITAHKDEEIEGDITLSVLIEYGNGHYLEFDELLPGWTPFLQQMEQKLPRIKNNWQNDFLISDEQKMVLFENWAEQILTA